MKENEVRICEKYALTVAEAAVYFGIGEKKLRSMIEEYSHLGLFIQNGVKYTIKRQKFEAFLDEAFAISKRNGNKSRTMLQCLYVMFGAFSMKGEKRI